MINSNDVSALIAAQNQQFAQAQSIGAVPLSQPNIGMSQYPASFSYAMPRTQQGVADRVSAGVVGAAGGVGTAVRGAGMIGGLGMLGVGLTGIGAGSAAAGVLGKMALLDPIYAGIAAGTGVGGYLSAGAAAGTGMGGMLAGMGVGAGGMAALGIGAGAVVGGGIAGLGMAGMYGAGQMMGGARDQMAMNNLLRDRVQFAGTGAGFQGFSYGQMGIIGEAANQFQRKDPFIGMRDMKQSLVSFTDLGMHQGVRDAEEFTGKFIKMTDTLNKMARALGTSMEGATGLFRDLRQAGFYSTDEIMGQTVGMQGLVGHGMSMGQAMGTVAAGAGIARGAGLTGASGGRAAANLADTLMRAPALLGIKDTDLMDIYGTSDLAGAAQAGSQRMTSALTRFLTSDPAGQAILMNVGSVEGGRFTGGVDADKIRELTTGNVGMHTLAARGSNRLGTSQRTRASFKTHTQDIAQEVLQNEDAMKAIISTMQNSAEYFGFGADEEDVVEILLKERMGLDRREARLMQQVADAYKRDRADSRRKITQQIRTDAARDYVAREASISGLMRKAGGTIQDTIGAPLWQAGADVVTGINLEVESAFDSVRGITRWNPSLSTGLETASMLTRGVGGYDSGLDFAMDLPGRTGRGEATGIFRGKSAEETNRLANKIAISGMVSAEDVFGGRSTGRYGTMSLSASQIRAIGDVRSTFGGDRKDKWEDLVKTLGGEDEAMKILSAQGHGDLLAEFSEGGALSRDNLVKQGQKAMDRAVLSTGEGAVVGGLIGARLGASSGLLGAVVGGVGGAMIGTMFADVSSADEKALKEGVASSVLGKMDNEEYRLKWEKALAGATKGGTPQEYYASVKKELVKAGISVGMEDIRLVLKLKDTVGGGSLSGLQGSGVVAAARKLSIGAASLAQGEVLDNISAYKGFLKGAGISTADLSKAVQEGDAFTEGGAFDDMLLAVGNLTEAKKKELSRYGVGASLLQIQEARSGSYASAKDFAAAMGVDEEYVTRAMANVGASGEFDSLSGNKRTAVKNEAARLAGVGIFGGGLGDRAGILLDDPAAMQGELIRQLNKLIETNETLAGHVGGLTSSDKADKLISDPE